MKRLVWILAFALVSASAVAMAGGPCVGFGYGVSGVYNPSAALPTPTGGPIVLNQVTRAAVPVEFIVQSDRYTKYGKQAVKTLLPAGGDQMFGGVARGIGSAFGG